MRFQRLEQLGDAPGPRSSHAVCAVGDHVYMFGGELQPRVPVEAALFRYDLGTGQWTRLKTGGTCPGPRVAATMVALGDKLYLFGGRTGVEMGEGAQADLFAFDTNTLTWSPVTLMQQHDQQTITAAQDPATTPTAPSAAPPPPAAPPAAAAAAPPPPAVMKVVAAAPPPRSYHAMAAAGGKLYVFGGCGAGGRLSDLWCFDPGSSSWQQLPGCAALGPRGGPVLVAAPGGTRLYVMGGFNGAELADCHEFDIGSSSWHCCQQQQQLEGSSGRASGPNGDGGGGATATDAAGSSSSSNSSSRSSILTMPLARSVFGAAAHGSCHRHSADKAAAAAGAGAGAAAVGAGGIDSCSTETSDQCAHCCHIVTFGGEVSPSDKGHAGAGNFSAAAYCLAPAAAAAACCTHAAAGAAGASGAAAGGGGGGGAGWHALEAIGGDSPGPRGWFAATAVGGGDLLIHGGLGADNERLGDMYRLLLHT